MAQSKIQKEIQRLNKEWAVVNLSGKTGVLHEIINPINNYSDVEFFTVESFHQYLANQKVEITEKKDGGKKSKKPVAISKIWFGSPDRRQYRGVIFDPGRIGNDDGYYNLFQGFAVKAKPGDWGLMYHHIKEVIANNDDVVFEYILAWLADLFQNTGGKAPGVAIVLRGDQGVGKGIFASTVGKSIGPHFAHVTSPLHFTGRFNLHLKDKILVFVDEAIWGGDKAVEGIVKGYITEDNLWIEPKGLNKFNVKNHMRFIIAGNNEWLVHAGPGERRMFVLDVSSRYQGNHEYFEDLAKQMNSGGREAMLNDLLEYKTDINLNNFPRTGALAEHVMRSWSPIQGFWFERLQEGLLSAEDPLWTGATPINFFYQVYIEYCKKLNIRHVEEKTVFGRELRKLCPVLKRTVPRIEGDRRQPTYEFPNLDNCRFWFEKK